MEPFEKALRKSYCLRTVTVSIGTKVTSPLKMSGKLALGVAIYAETPKIFQSTHIGYRAHCAVIFAIAWLSCRGFMPPSKK